ncbi:MAG TPA: FecR domain-containing protein [Bacteroidia bacterium]|nr:FecR domain-containing protein [Bacteroidia bacterium]
MKNEVDYSAIDILLAAYFAGEADSVECAQVEAWLKASEENRKYFEVSKKAWDASGELGAGKTFDTDAAWKKLQDQMHENPERTEKAKRNYTWAAAAGVLLVIGISSILWLTRGPSLDYETLAMTSATDVINDTLPDGTLISLNKNSKITYPSSFTGAQREITLIGEAFFDVSHDATHPFVIHTGTMDVKVLGTSFNVRAYPGGDSVHVSVKTGKVQCMANNDTLVILPGEYAVYNKGAGKIRKGNDDDPNRAAYRDRIFRFNNTPLGIAVQQLNDAYGCNIVLKNEDLKTCTFTTTKVFYNEPVENIIETIEVIFPGIASDTVGNTITLDGTGCK